MAVALSTPMAVKPAVSAASVTPTPPGTGMSPANSATRHVDQHDVGEATSWPNARKTV